MSLNIQVLYLHASHGEYLISAYQVGFVEFVPLLIWPLYIGKYINVENIYAQKLKNNNILEIYFLNILLIKSKCV